MQLLVAQIQCCYFPFFFFFVQWSVKLLSYFPDHTNAEKHIQMGLTFLTGKWSNITI